MPHAWTNMVGNNDFQKISMALQKIVANHPMTRLSRRHTATDLTLSSVEDIAQDLFTKLWEKGRFAHYLKSQMSDEHIEREIRNVELSHLLISVLAKTRPENYRMARRVGKLLNTSPLFRTYTTGNKKYGMAELAYGLKAWPDNKPSQNSGEFQEAISLIPTPERDCHRVGRWKNEIIISNNDLCSMLIKIFESIDSPTTLPIIRQLALSRLPLQDMRVTAIEDEEETKDGHKYERIAANTPDPEGNILQLRREGEIKKLVTMLVWEIRKIPNRNKNPNLSLRILWHCYFDETKPSQLKIAEMVGVSDSTVSDQKLNIEFLIRKLNLNLDHLGQFTEELKQQVILILGETAPTRRD